SQRGVSEAALGESTSDRCIDDSSYDDDGSLGRWLLGRIADTLSAAPAFVIVPSTIDIGTCKGARPEGKSSVYSASEPATRKIHLPAFTYASPRATILAEPGV